MNVVEFPLVATARAKEYDLFTGESSSSSSTDYSMILFVSGLPSITCMESFFWISYEGRERLSVITDCLVSEYLLSDEAF